MAQKSGAHAPLILLASSGCLSYIKELFQADAGGHDAGHTLDYICSRLCLAWYASNYPDEFMEMLDSLDEERI